MDEFILPNQAEQVSKRSLKKDIDNMSSQIMIIEKGCS